MHPPKYFCEQLYKVNDKLRCAWNGDQESFAIVQLYHIRNAGTPGNENTFYEFWNDPVTNTYNGPIFDKHGGTTRDWDPLFYRPIHLATLTDFGYTNEDLCEANFINVVKGWLRPLKEVLKESREEQIKEFKQVREDLVEEATDFLWREANKPDAASVIMANKHAKEDMKVWEKQVQRSAEINDIFKLPGL